MREFDKAAYAWCMALRQRSVEELQAFKLGVYAIARDDGDGLADVTKDHIAALEKQIAELEELIAAYERERWKSAKRVMDRGG
jgi:hypothetical protein